MESFLRQKSCQNSHRKHTRRLMLTSIVDLSVEAPASLAHCNLMRSCAAISMSSTLFLQLQRKKNEVVIDN
jgi:hypothetical protein